MNQTKMFSGLTSRCTTPAVPPLDSGATFSDCGLYRYRLWRVWDPAAPVLNALCLNPSSADATKNDATVERMVRRAKAWGHGGLVVTNLFAYRSTEPMALLQVEDPVGPLNNAAIQHAAIEAGRVLVGWGNHGGIRSRGVEVGRMLEELVAVREKLVALRVTKAGHPQHPLYVGYDVAPVPWTVAGLLAQGGSQQEGRGV